MMGLFDSKPAKTNMEKYEPQIREFILPGEEIEEIYNLTFDFLCFTNKRLIFVEKDLSFKEPKTAIYSIPYDKIHSVGIEKNEKLMALKDELILITKGKTHELKFYKGTNIVEVYNRIVSKII